MKRKYTGKYPSRIRSVGSIKGDRGIALLELNNGEKFTVQAADVAGCYPELGEDIRDYPTATAYGA